MKEYVLVEFLLPGEEYPTWRKILDELQDDFVELHADSEFEINEDGNKVGECIRVSGKISSEYASVIKLRDPYLAQRMRISYIDEELKNRYRR